MKILRKKGSIVLSLLLIFIMFLSTSCGSTSETSSQKVSNVKTIEDMAGRKVEIPKEIKSIATIGSVPVLNGFIMSFGEGDKIINGLPDFVKMPKWKYQLVFNPDLKNKEKFQNANYEPMIETILEKKPDVCITMDKKSAETMEAKGIKTLVLQWKDINDVEPLMTILGEVFNKQDKAKEYVKYFNDTVEKAEKLTSDIKDRKTALYANIKGLKQPHLIAEWWIKAAGGISVTDNGRKEETLSFSIEQLLQWNPNIVIVSNKSDVKKLKEDTRLSKLDAVKNNKVYITPTCAHVWANRTVEQPLTVLWTLNKLYPEKYSEKQLIADVTDFYKRFFETNLTEDQVKEIISGINK